MCNTMKAGSYGAWLSTVAGQMLTACPLQMMRGVQTRSAADIARELDIHWVVHRIVQDQLDYREDRAHWMPNNPTDDDKDCMGLYGPFLYPLDTLH